jgi:hypothetical protein
MKVFFLSITLFAGTVLTAQENKYASVALVSTQTDYPFGKFAALAGTPRHPGVEFGYGKSLHSTASKEWFIELRLSYFYHRYVQHGIPLTINFGYRHRFGDQFVLESSLGAGYLHSIPAAGKFKLDENGNYRNNKGLGRAQVAASFSLGAGYTVNPSAQKPFTLFTRYEQRIQFPFIKSYVPFLPYNSLYLGVQRPIKKRG